MATQPGVATRVAVEDFASYAISVTRALDTMGADRLVGPHSRIILKPNLVNHAPHPITTPAACVDAVIDYLRIHTNAHIIVAEGSGDGNTWRAFRELGYEELAARKNVELIDLDAQPYVRFTNHHLQFLKEFHIPEPLLDAFVVSIPVLKAHSMAKVTLCMKNMFGIAPARVYGGSAYKKAKLHGRTNDELQHYIFELNQYRKPDLCVLDATVGMATAHLWGPQCDPPVNKILASADCVAIDACGAQLLGFDWRSVGHIRMADGVLGHADNAC